MARKLNLQLLSGSLVCLLPVAAGAALYERLPPVVATHWNGAGVPDGYMPKSTAVFVLPLVMLGLNMLVHFMLEHDPKKQNMPAILKQLAYWLVPALALLAQGLTLAWAIGGRADIPLFASLFMGLVLVLIGNYLPKCKQNYTMGIRLPWTLHSEDNWNRTHRMAGYIWVAGGLVLLGNAFMQAVWLTIAVLAVLVAAPVVYSFALYRRDTRGAA